MNIPDVMRDGFAGHVAYTLESACTAYKDFSDIVARLLPKAKMVAVENRELKAKVIELEAKVNELEAQLAVCNAQRDEAENLLRARDDFVNSLYNV